MYIYALQKKIRSATLLSHRWHILWSPLASMPFGMRCIALLCFDGIPCSIQADQESNGKDIGYHWMIMPISHGRSYGRPWNHDKSAVSATFLSTTQQHEDHRGHSSGCHDWQVCLGPMQLVENDSAT